MTQETSEWVLLRQFSNPALARMTLDFLRDSGIRVELRGDTPDVVPSLYTPIDIRIVVPAEEVDAAREALEAFTAGPAMETPFRSVLPPEAHDDEAPMPPAKKHGAFGFVLAFLGLVLPPLGGAGHFYAHHNVTGIVLCVANVMSVGALLVRPGFPIALHVAIVLADAVFAFGAVQRYTRGAIPGRGAQALRGLAIVVAASVVAFAWQYTDQVLPQRALDQKNDELVERCNQRDGEACFDLAKLHQEHPAEYGTSDVERMYRRACELGFQRGCTGPFGP